MAVNIVFTGISLLRRSIGGLMDDALPDTELKVIAEAIRKHQGDRNNFV